MPRDPDEDLLQKLDRRERSKRMAQWALVAGVSLAAGALAFGALRFGAELPTRSSEDVGFIVACVLSIALARYRGLL
jgi:hypothetical protein